MSTGYNTITQFLLERNREQTQLFCSPDATLSRRKYRSEHPTEIAALKCMDGRLNLAVMTETPMGIIQPFRNIGGRFDLGWPYFGQVVEEWVRYSVSSGRNCLVLVTYHFSRGDAHRGCKGFGYDTEAAKEYVTGLKKQIETVYGTKHSVVYPIQVGIETDDDALVLHGEDGRVFDLSREPMMHEDELRYRVRQLYPDMRAEIVDDLLPLLFGNLRHIAEVRRSQRPITEVEHGEQIVAVGRGFDWIHVPNKAFIIGPYSYNLGEPIATAGKLLWDNVESGRVNKDEGLVLLTSGVYRDEAGPEMLRAAEKAR